jgi:hypothetical protein
VNHIGDTNTMVSDTPRTDAASGNSQDRSWMDGTLCRQLERELNAANERIKRLEEALVEIAYAASHPLGAGQSLTLGKIESIAIKAKEAKS